MKILITGSTGQLGSALRDLLTNVNYDVRITSRKKPKDIGRFEWIYSDFSTGKGFEDVLKDVNVVIHAATNPMKHTYNIDVMGFKSFLGNAHQIDHLIYPSIVGIEEIPLPYYKHKLEAENILKNSGIPYTLTRATQFHSFVDRLFLSKSVLNRYIVPGNYQFQSVDVNEFANYLIQFIEHGPQGKTDDFGGPEILTLKQMAELKIKINHESKKVISIPFPGKLSKSFIEGRNTNIKQMKGQITFEEFLIRKHSRS